MLISILNLRDLSLPQSYSCIFNNSLAFNYSGCDARKDLNFRLISNSAGDSISAADWILKSNNTTYRSLPSYAALEREFFTVCTVISTCLFILRKWGDVIWCLIPHCWKNFRIKLELKGGAYKLLWYSSCSLDRLQYCNDSVRYYTVKWLQFDIFI